MEGGLGQRDRTVACLQRPFFGRIARVPWQSASRTVLLLLKMFAVPSREMFVNRSRDTASGLVSEFLDRRKVGIPRRAAIGAELVFRQQRYQLLHLSLYVCRQFQIIDLGFLSHHRFLSNSAMFPNHSLNPNPTRQNRIARIAPARHARS